MITEKRFKRKRTSITPELINEIVRIYDTGVSMIQVARQLDISESTVRSIYKIYGLKARTTSECMKLYHKNNPGVQKGVRCPSWKGGRSVDGSGYYLITIPEDDPHVKMVQKKGYVMEHRYVMAKHLGRDLKPWEIVHHKNGDRKDNCIENLQLMANNDEHGKYTMSSHILAREVKKQEEKIKDMETRIKELEEEAKDLRKRVTLVEAENVMMKMQRCVS